MVSVCAGCDAYNAWTAVILGTISSIIYLMLSLILVSFKVDDPLDAFAIHFGGGILYSEINTNYKLLCLKINQKLSEASNIL